jgi:hypothetical protein
MKRIVATLIGALALSLGVWLGVASASCKLNVSWTMHGSYTCIPPSTCANTIGSGTAQADSSVLGAMTWTNAGGNGIGNPVCPRNLAGASLAETWVFTTQNGDTLTLTTDSDSLCFVSRQAVTETATFHISGATGSVGGATGNGTFSIVDLASPPNESGKFNVTLTLP